MSRYRGKREAPRPERGAGHKGDPFQDPFLEQEPTMDEITEGPVQMDSSSIPDPFVEETSSQKDWKVRASAVFHRWGAFWMSRKG